MTTPSFLRRPLFLIALAVGLAGLGAGAYFLWWKPRQEPLPGPETAAYQEYVQAFWLGVAGLDADRYEIAEKNLTRAIETIPGEPAAWADRGLLYLRYAKYPEAGRDLKRAQELAPGDADVETLLGLFAERQGRFPTAVAHLRQAVAARPEDLTNRYALAEMLEREATPEAEKERLRLLLDILKARPNNLLVLRDAGRTALQVGDAAAFKVVLARCKKLAPNWSEETQEQLARLKKKAAAQGLKGAASAEMNRLSGLLMKEPGFLQSSREIFPKQKGMGGRPLYHFVRLSPPKATPAEPDLQLTFKAGPVAPGAERRLRSARWDVVQPVWLGRGKKPAVFVANASTVRRADAAGPDFKFPGGEKKVAPTAHGLLALDWNNNHRTDLLLAGAGGLRFLQQDEDGNFSDVTAKTKLKPEVLRGNYYGAWAVDYDLDGDLDIILAPREGAPLVLRNNGNGTFKAVRPFKGVKRLRDFAWADFDNDGAADAALLDANGKLHVFSNQRSGRFRARALPDNLGKLLALTVADVNDDGVLDLVALGTDGALVRISDRDRGRDWEVAEIARWPDFPTRPTPGSVRLLTADLDNNGGLDLIASGPPGTRVWLSDSKGQFQPLPHSPLTLPSPPATGGEGRVRGGQVFAAVDLAGKGQLDLLGVSRAGRPVRLVNRGTKDYSWQKVEARAHPRAKGDDRVNASGIGSEVQVRTGTLVQKQMTFAPVTHFGLGERKRADVIRIVWPNGTAQVEFTPAPNQVLTAHQRLSGSCPFLFTYDGRGMRFVKDFMWSTPLGMYINGQAKGDFLQTTEWVKIRGDQLRPCRGYYDVRVTANLWEVHYDDYLALAVVDHPKGTEVFVDESFPLVRREPKVTVTDRPRPLARAVDDRGKDVTALVRAVDGRYLDTFGLGKYQGLTRDHWVEVDLGRRAPTKGPVWLVAHGWLQPTDSSINFALEQGEHDRPRPLVLEVPDGRGGWKVARDDLGFPAGKNKTMLIRLDGVAGKGVARRFRLRTNMEIYWDALHYARGLDEKLARLKWLRPARAELRYRGFLHMTRANRSSPELPHYDKVVGKTQRWRDQTGFYTRYGDVRQLLTRTDDRYVIMNAGDEIAFRFPVPAGPRKSYQRDFIWASDGWTKDGNLNTRFSQTVLPLPAHDLKTYDRPPGRLEDDPVYRCFPHDWKKYHTRWVTPEAFERGLRPLLRERP
jgi:tetratricopeptide (TPR) repeat protein